MSLEKRVPILRWFDFEHLPAGPMRERSRECAGLAYSMAAQLRPGDELDAGLRHLLAAKDCFVRAAMDTAYRDGAAVKGLTGADFPDTGDHRWRAQTPGD